MEGLDQIDTQILDLLQHDARVTTKELADKLGLTITPVSVRIKKLEEAGYIKRYVAILDRDKVGKALIAFTSVQLREHTQSALKAFEQKSVKIKEVMECYRLTGNFDFLLKIAIRDMREYNDFLMNKLSTLPNIGSVQTYFVLSEGKSETAYPLDINLSAR
ncbi:AsnC family transcriptional regulator [Niastella yeongjuensis]|uniref:AsnC family transcriptional regulator n=1 Tax=Niastella yeongjuensis TaxID=354355 RepID=A0A1V9F7T5_9BACT|nr:Lrp/AsnC family transcriptional regulator [Niastella yeongjuensis]OQP54276.1 AsnC family transcriptional regulator [Niastella yeongjuensis]SEP30955.1 DNA-binding transcriptional regulator, Lrp family [Niastella yeongjuensis]